MKGITKSFPGVVANNAIDFALYGGEVHALLGENGAGKTTLMNILYGLYRPDSGEILVKGNESASGPQRRYRTEDSDGPPALRACPDAHCCGERGAGAQGRKGALLNLDSVVKRVNELAKDYGLLVNPNAMVGQLSVGERQRVEIIKALYREADTLILDEPTSVLTPQEVEGLFHFMRSMAAEGRAVVVITHKLPEVMAVSDRVTVLRHGEVVARLKTKDTNPNELAEKMVGREIPHKKGTA